MLPFVVDETTAAAVAATWHVLKASSLGAAVAGVPGGRDGGDGDLGAAAPCTQAGASQGAAGPEGAPPCWDGAACEQGIRRVGGEETGADPAPY